MIIMQCSKCKGFNLKEGEWNDIDCLDCGYSNCFDNFNSYELKNITSNKHNKVINFIIKIEGLLQHNLKLNYINKETTVEELLIFLNNIKSDYLPFQKKISKIVKNL